MTLSSLRPRTGLRATLCFLLCLSLGRSQIGAEPIPAGKPAAYPDWWFTRSVIPRQNQANQTPAWPGDYRQPEDYAVLNEGQLKTLVTAAYDEFEAHLSLSGGAGTVAREMVKSWYNVTNGVLPPAGSRVPKAGTTSYTAINLGQLKKVAQPFYDRLKEQSLCPGYPWQFSDYEADDHAVANLGMAKNLFRFKLSEQVDQYGIPPWFEATLDSEEAIELARMTNPGGLRDPRDTDNDGRLDRDEIRDGTDPLQSDLLDSDGDGVPDYRDAWPDEPLLNGRRQPDPHYAIVEVYRLAAHETVEKIMLGEGGQVAWELSRDDQPNARHTAHCWAGIGSQVQPLLDPEHPDSADFHGIVSIDGGGGVFGYWTKSTFDGLDGCTADPVNLLEYPSAVCIPGWIGYSDPVPPLFSSYPWLDGQAHTRFASSSLRFLVDRHGSSWSTRSYHGETMTNDFNNVHYCLDTNLPWYGTKLLASGNFRALSYDGAQVNTVGLGLGSPQNLEAAFAPPNFTPNLNAVQPAILSGGDSLTFLTCNDVGGFVATAPPTVANPTVTRLFYSEVDEQATRSLFEITSPAFPAAPSSIVALSNDGVILTRESLCAKEPSGSYKEIKPFSLSSYIWKDFNVFHTAVGREFGTNRAMLLNNDKVFPLASRCGIDPALQLTFLSGSPMPQIINDKGMIVGQVNSAPYGAIVLLVPVQMSWESPDGWDNVGNNKSSVDFRYAIAKPLPDGDPMPDGRWLPGRGRRIFAEAPKPSGGVRNTAVLKIHVPTGIATSVFLKSFDVDDATDETFDLDAAHHPVIDTNGRVGDDNRDTVWPKAGQFIVSGSPTGSTVQVALNGSGDGQAFFQTTMQPGDNFRVALALQQATLTPLQVGNSIAAGFVPSGSEDNPSEFVGVVSPLLTVWRTLHIEEDTMAQVPVEGPQKNYELGTIMGVSSLENNHYLLYLSTELSGGIDRFQGGAIRILSWRGKVVGNTTGLHSAVTIQDDDAGHFAALHAAGNAFDQAFYLEDDDNRFMPGEFKLPLSQSLITESVVARFVPAYIELKLAKNRKKSLPFFLNIQPPHPVSPDQKDIKEFWAHRVIGAYQPSTSKDGDPDSENEFGGGGADAGLTHKLFRSDSMIYLEVIRDFYSQAAALGDLGRFRSQVYGVVAHEIGHGPGPLLRPDDHDEEGLMAAAAGSIDFLYFMPKSILRFREATKWH